MHACRIVSIMIAKKPFRMWQSRSAPPECFANLRESPPGPRCHRGAQSHGRDEDCKSTRGYGRCERCFESSNQGGAGGRNLSVNAVKPDASEKRTAASKVMPPCSNAPTRGADC